MSVGEGMLESRTGTGWKDRQKSGRGGGGDWQTAGNIWLSVSQMTYTVTDRHSKILSDGTHPLKPKFSFLLIDRCTLHKNNTPEAFIHSKRHTDIKPGTWQTLSETTSRPFPVQSADTSDSMHVLCTFAWAHAGEIIIFLCYRYLMAWSGDAYCLLVQHVLKSFYFSLLCIIYVMM